MARRAPQPIKPKPRNGRTYTMLEQEEQNLRQQLMERDMRLQESERRQEVSFLTFQKSDFLIQKDGV